MYGVAGPSDNPAIPAWLQLSALHCTINPGIIQISLIRNPAQFKQTKRTFCLHNTVQQKLAQRIFVWFYFFRIKQEAPVSEKNKHIYITAHKGSKVVNLVQKPMEKVQKQSCP